MFVNTTHRPLQPSVVMTQSLSFLVSLSMSFAVTRSRASSDAPDQRPRDPGEAGGHAEADDPGVVDAGVESLHHAAADGRAPAAEAAADAH